MAIEIVDLPINSMVDLSIVMWWKTGWWYTYPSEKMNVRWDDDIPIWKNKSHVPNHQPKKYGLLCILFQIYMLVA